MDISKQLHAYEVEYHVLQEEMAPSPVHQRSRAVTDIQKLEGANRNLRRHNNELLEQLQGAHTSIHSQEAMIHNLRVRIQAFIFSVIYLFPGLGSQ